MNNRVVLLGLITLSLLLINVYIHVNSSETIMLSQKEVDGLYRVVEAFDKVATRNNLDYFITCGTLLGALRNKGLIPWDNDIDICIQSTDLPRLLALKPEFEKLGISLPYTDGIHRVDGLGGFIDIFPVVYDLKRGKLVHEDVLNRTRFPKEEFDPEWVYPTQRIQFGPLFLKAPANPTRCVEQMYGSNWSTPIDMGKNKSSLKSWITRSTPANSVALPSKNFLTNYK